MIVFFKCMLPDFDLDDSIVAGLTVFLKYMLPDYTFGEHASNSVCVCD